MSNLLLKCPYCGREFLRRANGQKYCSLECRKNSYREFETEYRKRRIDRKRGFKQAKNATLCWRCKNACCGCEWSKYFIPVEGWVAIPTKIRFKDNKNSYTDSYKVISCPKFEKG